MAKNIVVTDEFGTASAAPELANLKVAQLRVLAQQLGIRGYLKLKKAELVQALEEHQRGGAVAAPAAPKAETPAEKTSEKSAEKPAAKTEEKAVEASVEAPAEGEKGSEPVQKTRRTRRTRAQKDAEAKAEKADKSESEAPKSPRSVPVLRVTRPPLRSVPALAAPPRARTPPKLLRRWRRARSRRSLRSVPAVAARTRSRQSFPRWMCAQSWPQSASLSVPSRASRLRTPLS